MTIPRPRLSMLALALAPALMLAGNTPAPAANNTGAIIGGIIAGAPDGAAGARAGHHPRRVYVRNPPPPRPPGPNPWANAFQPAANVTCYPVQQACYRADGAYAPGWTNRVYGG